MIEWAPIIMPVEGGSSIHARWFQRDTLNDLRFRRGLQNYFPDDAIPPHQHAGDGQDRGREADNDPDDFQRKNEVGSNAAESAEVQPWKPEEDIINRARHRPGVVERLNVIDNRRDPFLKDQI